jgi:hypothetical protein
MKSRVRTRTHGSVRGRHPSGVPPTRLSTKNSKAAVILARCAILGPATAVFRCILPALFVLFVYFKLFGFLDTDGGLGVCGY